MTLSVRQIGVVAESRICDQEVCHLNVIQVACPASCFIEVGRTLTRLVGYGFVSQP